MDGTRLPIFQTALLGWQDGFRALGQMPKMAIKALIIIILCGLVFSPFMPKDPIDRPFATELYDKSVGTVLLGFALSTLQSFFLVPIAIAVHRYILLGEITETYFPDPGSPRFRSFFFFGVLIQAIMLLPSLSNGLLSFLLFCLAVFFCARLIMLFPAIAIDGPGGNLAGGWQNSSGHFWPIFATIVLCMLPGLLVVVLLSLIPAALLFASLPLAVIATFVAPALASHLYRGLVQQAHRPAQP
jgi:hypothetical protein